MNDSLSSLTGALAALLEVPALAESLKRSVELAHTLTVSVGEANLPPEVRPEVPRIAAAVALAPSLTELMRFADVVDFRDLNEHEFAYLEGVSIKTVRRWRTDGTGPEYRCEAGVSYPLRWIWEWRERGRQRMTSQKMGRGWRP